MNDNQFKEDVKSAVKESITELCIIKRIDSLDDFMAIEHDDKSLDIVIAKLVEHDQEFRID